MLSHIGSGAVIMQRRLEEGLAGRDLPDDFSPPVWDEWNAKSSEDKAASALVADDAFIDRLEALTDDERARFSFSLGPFTFDTTGLVSLRLNEHTLHTWDIEVARDSRGDAPPEGVSLVIDNLDLIGRFTARPDGGDLRRSRSRPATRAHVSRWTSRRTRSRSRPSLRPASVNPPPMSNYRPKPSSGWSMAGSTLQHTGDASGDAALLDRLRHVFPGP